MWIQPRLIDGDRPQMLSFLSQGAQMAERLRRRGEVVLKTGCELTVFTAGFIPGRTFLSRVNKLMWTFPLLPWYSARLNRHLVEVARVARERFDGPQACGKNPHKLSETPRLSRRLFDAGEISAEFETIQPMILT